MVLFNFKLEQFLIAGTNFLGRALLGDQIEQHLLQVRTVFLNRDGLCPINGSLALILRDFSHGRHILHLGSSGSSPLTRLLLVDARWLLGIAAGRFVAEGVRISSMLLHNSQSLLRLHCCPALARRL